MAQYLLCVTHGMQRKVRCICFQTNFPIYSCFSGKRRSSSYHSLARLFVCVCLKARRRQTMHAYHTTLRLSANSSCKHTHTRTRQIHSQNNYFFADLNRLHFAICLCIYISCCCCCWIIAFFSFAVFYFASLPLHSLCLSNRTSSIRVGCFKVAVCRSM